MATILTILRIMWFSWAVILVWASLTNAYCSLMHLRSFSRGADGWIMMEYAHSHIWRSAGCLWWREAIRPHVSGSVFCFFVSSQSGCCKVHKSSPSVQWHAKCLLASHLLVSLSKAGDVANSVSEFIAIFHLPWRADEGLTIFVFMFGLLLPPTGHLTFSGKDSLVHSVLPLCILPSPISSWESCGLARLYCRGSSPEAARMPQGLSPTSEEYRVVGW